MLALVMLGLLVGFLIAIPLLLVGLLLRLVIGLIVLPFQIAGFAIRLTLGFVAAVFGLILAGVVLLIPLLPIIALVGGIWLIFRLSRRQAPARLVSS